MPDSHIVQKDNSEIMFIFLAGVSLDNACAGRALSGGTECGIQPIWLQSRHWVVRVLPSINSLMKRGQGNRHTEKVNWGYRDQRQTKSPLRELGNACRSDAVWTRVRDKENTVHCLFNSC